MSWRVWWTGRTVAAFVMAGAIFLMWHFNISTGWMFVVALLFIPVLMLIEWKERDKA